MQTAGTVKGMVRPKTHLLTLNLCQTGLYSLFLLNTKYLFKNGGNQTVVGPH